MKTENKSAVTEALEMIELNLRQFPNAFLALNGTWGECIKALEKQIPKKPAVSEDQPVRYVITYKCPDCGGKFTGTVSNYCYHCGQALDWSEENEM